MGSCACLVALLPCLGSLGGDDKPEAAISASGDSKPNGGVNATARSAAGPPEPRTSSQTAPFLGDDHTQELDKSNLGKFDVGNENEFDGDNFMFGGSKDIDFGKKFGDKSRAGDKSDNKSFYFTDPDDAFFKKDPVFIVDEDIKVAEELQSPDYKRDIGLASTTYIRDMTLARDRYQRNLTTIMNKYERDMTLASDKQKRAYEQAERMLDRDATEANDMVAEAEKEYTDDVNEVEREKNEGVQEEMEDYIKEKEEVENTKRKACYDAWEENEKYKKEKLEQDRQRKIFDDKKAARTQKRC